MQRPFHILACVIMALTGLALLAMRAGAAPPQTGSFRISGMTVDAESGAPLAKVTVSLLSTHGNREAIGTVMTGADGRFEFNQLAAGKYALLAQRRGYLTQSLDEHEGFSTGVAVGPDLVAEGIYYRLQPEASISGHVLDEANDPVGGAQVMLFTEVPGGMAKMQQTRQALTDDQGFFRLPHLLPRKYMLAVSARPWYAEHPMPYERFDAEGKAEVIEPAPSALDVAYPLTFYLDATDAESATPIALSAGERATADVMLQAMSAIHLRIHTPVDSAKPGLPYNPAGVSVRKQVFDADVYVQPATFQRAGLTEVGGLAPGRYEVSITTRDGEKQTESRQELDLSTSRDIESKENAAALVAVGGTLRFEDGTAAKNASGSTVWLRELKSERKFAAPVEADGSFAFGQSLGPGKYEVALAEPGVYLKSVSASGARVAGREISVGSKPVKLALIAGRGLATVDGTAFREGKPRAGAMVVLVPEKPAGQEILFRRDQSDSDGTFTLPSVVPGRYVVIALERWGIRWLDPDVLRTYTPQGQAIEVQPNGKYKVTVQVQ